MKRIELHYGSQAYTVGFEDYEELRAQIAAAVAAGHGWLRVNHGEGSVAVADLLITPGVPIALLTPEAHPSAERTDD